MRWEKTGDRFQKSTALPFCGRSGGEHGEKMVCVRGVPGVTGTRGKTNRHFDPIKMGLGTVPTTLRRLLIGAENL